MVLEQDKSVGELKKKESDKNEGAFGSFLGVRLKKVNNTQHLEESLKSDNEDKDEVLDKVGKQLKVENDLVDYSDDDDEDGSSSQDG